MDRMIQSQWKQKQELSVRCGKFLPTFNWVRNPGTPVHVSIIIIFSCYYSSPQLSRKNKSPVAKKSLAHILQPSVHSLCSSEETCSHFVLELSVNQSLEAALLTRGDYLELVSFGTFALEVTKMAKTMPVNT